jgi:formate hydrogenlyase transcriptional activator
MDMLHHYSWPGNIRELRNVIERAMIVSKGASLQIDISGIGERRTFSQGTLEEVEKKHIIDVLESTGWKVSGEKGAARVLGLNPKTLESRMKKLGITRQR